MNKYYHHFTLGFNYWMLFGVLLLVVAAVVGFTGVCIARERDGYSISSKRSDSFISIFIGLCGVTFASMLAVESHAGIIQWLDNGLSESDSGAWSILGFMVIVPAAGVIYAMTTLWVASFFEGIRIKMLEKKAARMNRELFRKEAAKKARVAEELRYEAMIDEMLGIAEEAEREAFKIRLEAMIYEMLIT